MSDPTGAVEIPMRFSSGRTIGLAGDGDPTVHPGSGC